MNVTVCDREEYVLAELDGVIDDDAGPVFREQLHTVIEVPGSRLVLDLSRSQRITSAGIGHLVTLVSRANAKESRVILARPSLFVDSIFKVTKLQNFLEVVPTIEEAVARVRA